MADLNDFEKDMIPQSVKDMMDENEKLMKRFSEPSLISNVPNFSYPSLDNYSLLPNIKIPTEEEKNEYQSASVFMKALADAAIQWRDELDDNYQPAVLAVMYGGIQIQVSTMAQVSFHGIRIQGKLNGSPCTMLAHQSTVQVMCFATEVTEEEPKNPIGFIWADNNVVV